MSVKKHVDLDTLDYVISAIPSNIFLKDTELRYIFSSHIWEQVNSGDDEEFDIYGKTDRDIRKDTANLEKAESLDRQILETGVGTRYTIKSEVDGHIQYLELVKEPVRDADGKIIGIVGLINDVTAVTQEISDMLENEKSYREAMKEGAMLSYSVNLTKDILTEDLIETIDGKEVNLIELIGMKAPCCYSEMADKYAKTILIGESQKDYLEFHNVQRFIELYNSGKRELVKEFRLLINGMDGVVVEKWVYETVLLMHNTDGDITAFITVNDTTEQRKKEEEIRHQLEENVKEAERVANMKSDFLANMSHEIRTPMNAVIGMAEIALREDLPDSAREYINQIKSSGTALLNIINDILDFSKIESGKMDIIPDNYNPLSATHDVSSILLNRIGDKDIEYLGNVNPNLPTGVYGDIQRIRQIIINLANNAIKFTQKGFVRTDIDFEKISDDEVMLKVAVVDSGIGIKEEDLNKLFVSFQQVDSKRNRNIEGTGLGLAICSKLVGLMGGTIGVSSEYGRGSVFHFELPQKITDWTPSVVLKEKDKRIVINCWENSLVMEQVDMILDRIGVKHYSYEDFETAKIQHGENFDNKNLYFLANIRDYRDRLCQVADEHPEIQFIVSCDMVISKEQSKPNVIFIKKPLSTIGIIMAMNNEFIHVLEKEATEISYAAPDANVLIVDDNEVNLVVAQGLLEPLEMNIKTALSGKKALEMIESEAFDIVFMDHMMPELDGVETTRIIRRLHPELDNMPIIALSANAVGNAKEMFLSEGMNDFVAKPIEIKAITNAISKWLPKEKLVVKSLTDSDQPGKGAAEDKLVIGDLDVDAAIALIGSKKLYLTILEKYFGAIKSKAEIIKSSEVAEDISTYTIEVHALKSASKQIGAMELSAMAAELEACGNAGDIATIHAKTDALVERYLGYDDVLSPMFKTEEVSDKPAISTDQLLDYFDKMLAAVDDLDMDAMEEISAAMDEFGYEGEAAGLMAQLKEAAANIDVDSIEEIINSWKGLL